MERQQAAASVVQRAEFGRQRLDVGHVRLADRLDLPVNEMKAAVTPCVTCVALERAVLGMDVQLDAPPHVGNRQVNVHRTAACAVQYQGLALDRHASDPQRFGEGDLGV